MASEFKLPELGENIESGDIVNVLVKEGDDVAADQTVFEVETGKATVDLPSPQAGRISKVHVQKGSKVKVGDALLTFESADKQAAPAPQAVTAPQATAAPQTTAAPKAAAPQPAAPAPGPRGSAEQAGSGPRRQARSSGSGGRGGRAARQAAAGRSFDPAPGPGAGSRSVHVNGTGAGGRITEEDVKAAVREGAGARSSVPVLASTRTTALPAGADGSDTWGPIRRSPLPAIRKAIAVNMARSSSTIPHVTNFDDADITELERIRKGGLADYVESHVKLTMMAFVMKAVAQSLKLHPAINASIDMEAEQIIYKDYVNIGVAVDTDRGLIVLTVRDVDRMSIPQIARSLMDVAECARTGKFSPDDLRGSTFTISNMGSIGGTYSTPIINPPNVAILLTGRSRKLPVVVDDRIEPRLMMPLSLSYDHRLVDGAAASRFLNEVINYLKVPGRLLLAP